MASARPSESVIRNALKAWSAVMGEKPGGLEIAPDGTVRILAVDVKPESPQPRGPKKW
jgi:hypothetical protein